MVYTPLQSRVNGTFINYVKVGNGPPIVFVHGWSNNWQGWETVIPYLKDRFTLYLIDLPGFGDSGDLPRYSVEGAADKVAEFCKLLAKKPEVVVGISMGTFIASMVGIRHPDAAKRIVLVSPILKGRRQRFLSKEVLFNLKVLNKTTLTKHLTKSVLALPATAHFLSRYLMMYRYNKKVVEDCGITGKAKMRIDAFIQMGISACRIKPVEMVSQIPLPTLFIIGDKDKFASIKFIENSVLPLSKRLRLEVISDAGHAAPWEKAKEVSIAISHFIHENQKVST